MKTFFSHRLIFIYSRKVMPYYTQFMKQETDDDMEWQSLSTAEQKYYKKLRKEVRLTGDFITEENYFYINYRRNLHILLK